MSVRRRPMLSCNYKASLEMPFLRKKEAVYRTPIWGPLCIYSPPGKKDDDPWRQGMAHMLQKSQLISTYGAAEVQSQSGKRCIMGATEVHNSWHVGWTRTNLRLCSILLSAWFKMRVENGGQLDGDGIWCNHLERKSEIDLLPCKWMFWVPANDIHILEEVLLLKKNRIAHQSRHSSIK